MSDLANLILLTSVLSTSVYDDYAKNPPGLLLAGRSTWKPGKALENFLQTLCNIRPYEQTQRIEKICEAVVSVTPDVIAATQSHPHFYETGKRMLHAWNEGMNSARLHKSWSLPSLKKAIGDTKFFDPQPCSPKPKDTIARHNGDQQHPRV